jgi:hypothetical protein
MRLTKELRVFYPQNRTPIRALQYDWEWQAGQAEGSINLQENA